MPLYDYRCLTCGTAWEDKKLIVERDEPLKEPCIVCGATDVVERYLPSTFGLAYSVERLKHSDGFNDLLKNMKSKHRHSTINAR
jgi:DNA-directed RNA polymerase subunit RPC12/RpoP